MTLKFKEMFGSDKFLYLLPSKSSNRTYWVYLDDEIIGTTAGQEVIGRTEDYDDILVVYITFNKYGKYCIDARALMNRMMKSMTIYDLLALGKKV